MLQSPESQALTGAWHVLPPLPYAPAALEPVISARTLGCHHGVHHKAYVENLNRLAAGTPFATMPLEAIVANTVDVPTSVAIYRNAAQAWSHAFHWRSLKPAGQAVPPAGELRAAMTASFGSFAACRAALTAAATSHFGSGWLWLVQLPGARHAGNDAAVLQVLSTADADVPMSSGLNPLLCIDLWEHAYYLDYQAQRAGYVDALLERLVDWQAAAGRLA